ncbi:hypothetical protein TCE0_033r09383 [Talaromyces pinophilus]|uniref:Peptidase M3A/M3B catalytic domain-containing protein n=1 Tax=Talaromyces pinophilus TaxID=128442 RepID=A0A6V8HJX9_TALPI|nr:hypothetical protein TCE0_033r09383 [Talaromyces pinophilus]
MTTLFRNAFPNFMIDTNITPPVYKPGSCPLFSIPATALGVRPGIVNMKFPQVPASFSTSPAGLLDETARLIEEARSLYAQLVDRISPENATFANTILPLSQSENRLLAARKLFGFYNSTSTSSELREASGRASVLFDAFDSETWMRDDLFRLVSNVVCNQEKENLSAEDAYYLRHKHQNFLRNGLGIAETKQRARFTQVQTLLREKALEAQQCINKSHGLWLSAEELNGFPRSALSTLKKGEAENEGKLWFPLTRAQIARALQFIEKESTRRKIYIANDNRCLENVPRLKEIILLRDESARLLGFPSFMDLSILDKMARSADLIHNYILELRRKLRTAGQRELKGLLELKTNDRSNDPNISSEIDPKLYLWDYNFYKTILTKTRRNFDEELFSEYFPLEQTLAGIMEIYSSLFGLDFVEIPAESYSLLGKDHIMVWHADVSVYSVWNDETQGGDFLGYLYLDLFPRENKYNHAGHYGLVPIDQVSSNTTRFDLLFHEFGHAVHNLVSRVKYAIFHGTSTARDFVEIPSIMLENWWWEPSLIKNLGNHYSYLSDEYLNFWKNSNDANTEQPHRTIDSTLIHNLIQTRHTDGVIGVLKQCHIAEFDIAIHSQKTHHDVELLNLSSKWNQLQKEVTLLSGPEADGEGWDWGHGSARFGLLVRGYEAGYYSYPLGKAYAQDLFKTRFEHDPMSRKTALEFRRVVLEPGGSRNGAELLKEFLERDVSITARFQELGLTTDKHV